jgi:four helix bundle protein
MGEETRGYKYLIVWQKAMDLAPEVYKLLKRLPRDELYALADQIRRAAISILANIAEGQARHHPGEFVQHLSIARGNLAELDTLLLLAERLDYLKEEDLTAIAPILVEVRRLLQGLIQSIRKKYRLLPTPVSRLVRGLSTSKPVKLQANFPPWQDWQDAQRA